VKRKQSTFYDEADSLSSFPFTNSAGVMTTCFKAERLFSKTSVRACIVSRKQQCTTGQYELSLSSKRQIDDMTPQAAEALSLLLMLVSF